MKKTWVIITILLLNFSLSYGQSWKLMRWELVGGLGTANVFGDLTGVSPEGGGNLYGLKDITVFDSRPSLMFAMRYKVSNRFSARLNLVYGRGYSDGNKTDKTNRDGIAKTNLFELSPQAEYYFIREERKARSAALFNRRGMLNNYSTFSSYLFAGVGGLYYKPTITGSFVDDRTRLHPNIAPQEFSGLNKSNFTVVFPMGIGVKYILDSRFVLGLELGGRLTLTDKIDGFEPIASLTSPPSGKDVYYFSSVNISYKLRTNRNGWPEIFISKPHKGGGLPFGGGSGFKPKSKKEALKGNDDPKIRNKISISWPWSGRSGGITTPGGRGNTRSNNPRKS